MKFSNYAEHYSSQSGIVQLMDDLGSADQSDSRVIMLGGGNPAAIPEIQTRLTELMQQLLNEGKLVKSFKPGAVG